MRERVSLHTFKRRKRKKGKGKREGLCVPAGSND
jgi:hypothetical protein